MYSYGSFLYMLCQSPWVSFWQLSITVSPNPDSSSAKLGDKQQVVGGHWLQPTAHAPYRYIPQVQGFIQHKQVQKVTVAKQKGDCYKPFM